MASQLWLIWREWTQKMTAIKLFVSRWLYSLVPSGSISFIINIAMPCPARPALRHPASESCCGAFLSGLALFPGSDAEQPKRVELSQIATSPPSLNNFIRNPASRRQLYTTTSTQLPHNQPQQSWLDVSILVFLRSTWPLAWRRSRLQNILLTRPTGGKGGKGLGKGGAKRHRKILRDNIQGITKPAIRRLARRGGVSPRSFLLGTSC
jgi:hypothetical protein